MNCAEIEILICEYVDGTLAAPQKAAVELHLAECPACAELARDSADAIAFMQRAADVEAPPELVTRILFDAPWTKAKARSGIRSSITTFFAPFLTPKYVMGMAMTVLWLSMLAKFVAPVKTKLTASDLQPSKVWAGLEDRAARAWARTAKFYDNLKFVYQIQTTLREWQQQDDERRSAETSSGTRKANEAAPDDRRLPVRNAPSPSEAPPGGAPLSNPPEGKKN